MFSTMCLDAASGRGTTVTRFCSGSVTGAPTSSGPSPLPEGLKGSTGKCITLNGGAIANFTEMAIFPCTGVATQKWAFGAP